MFEIVTLNGHLYNQLILRDFDHFTVSELIDVVVKVENFNENKDKLTKLVYRQLTKLVKHGYLGKSELRRGRSIVFYKTTIFDSKYLSIQPQRRALLQVSKKSTIESSPQGFYQALSNERRELEAYQVIAIREMEKYKELLSRYPEEASFINPFYLESRAQATNIQGDLEAVTKLLKHYPSPQGNNQ